MTLGIFERSVRHCGKENGEVIPHHTTRRCGAS